MRAHGRWFEIPQRRPRGILRIHRDPRAVFLWLDLEPSFPRAQKRRSTRAPLLQVAGKREVRLSERVLATEPRSSPSKVHERTRPQERAKRRARAADNGSRRNASRRAYHISGMFDNDDRHDRAIFRNTPYPISDSGKIQRNTSRLWSYPQNRWFATSDFDRCTRSARLLQRLR